MHWFSRLVPVQSHKYCSKNPPQVALIRKCTLLGSVEIGDWVGQEGCCKVNDWLPFATIGCLASIYERILFLFIHH